MRHILITGGAGFIGSHVAELFAKKYDNYIVTVLDKLTYASNMNNLTDAFDESNFGFVKGDICDYKFLKELHHHKGFTDIIHLAAESHVDNSHEAATLFAETNILGTINLLNLYRTFEKPGRFYQVSTDEVYGSLSNNPYEKFDEDSSYDPHNIYSASKASADHFVRSYHNTFGLDVVLSNCSNNYGPHQHPEKFIPNCIKSLINREPIRVYGNGENIRDWLHVYDHAKAIDKIFHEGKTGETYLIGSDNEWSNIDLARALCNVYDGIVDNPMLESNKLITFVEDRPGHDSRYAINAVKLRVELGWTPTAQFFDGLKQTVNWYMENKDLFE